VTTSPRTCQRWAELGEHRLVGQARIAGLMGALELVPHKGQRTTFAERGTVGTLCRDNALRHGLILRATYDSMLLSPPLVITARRWTSCSTRPGRRWTRRPRRLQSEVPWGGINARAAPVCGPHFLSNAPHGAASGETR